MSHHRPNQPRKHILTRDQLDAFQSSQTYEDVISFIEKLNDGVDGVKSTAECEESLGTKAVLEVLDAVEQLAKETPPVDNKGSRFGNPAFRTFYDKLVAKSAELHAKIPGLPEEAVGEVDAYFKESWGNRTRIDYGSGMELNFLCWLLCLERLGVFHESDHKALVIRVFWRYIAVMRVLQSTYWLEPAGSHGVWGLDDYHFLPFLFGSAQLRGHKYIRPKSIHDKDVVDEYSTDYMYLACIKFINSIKTGSLRWHSPMLDDISGVKTWEKVNTGMVKMYRAEVLGKLPVIQHFLFGSILPYKGPPCSSSSSSSSSSSGAEDGENVDDGHWGHAHAHAHAHVSGQRREVGWGDCCGIPVPSAFAAAAAEKGEGPRLEGPAVRPVPFD